MPHRLSLLRRLAELRACYTGETDSAVLPTLSNSVQNLDHRERGQLLETLDHNYATRLLGENTLPSLPLHIKNSVLPDASTRGQWQLETGIALAASNAVNYLHLRQPIDLTRSARVFRMVRPQLGGLILHLEPAALAPLLFELMPRHFDGELHGIPGLRARLLRRHVELYLVDTEPVASVVLANVSFRQWNAAMAFIDAVCKHDDELRWLGNEVKPLTEIEQETLSQRHRVPGPIQMISALLRRNLLFATAPWLTLWTNGCNSTSIEWPAGPSIPRVTQMLIHPIAGLPGTTFQILHSGEDYLSIVDYVGERCIRHPHMGPVKLVLRTAAAQESNLDHFQLDNWHDANTAWAAWEEALSAPAEALPRTLPPRFS